MADKPEICSHFFSPRNPSRKTCAEIVREARQSLRVQSTRRPFTPRDAHRQLFGTSSVRVDHVNRPPSSFSLHAQNFEAPDSRPGSGTRLAPLDHKPKFPVLSDAEEVFKLSPKPPAEPPEVKRGLSGPRARLLRAGSLPLIPPVQTGTDGPGSGQKQPSAKRLHSADHTSVHSSAHRPSPQRTASESRIKQPFDDSRVRPTNCTKEKRTGPENGPQHKSTEKEEGSSVRWDEKICPLVQQLETAAAAVTSQWSICVICAIVFIASWRRRTCSAGAVRGGQGFSEPCSASLTSNQRSSTCTLPSSAWSCV
uniref:Armadillo repeat containing 2 n=1 Tax=Cynoglossus semilaevis TaxID=244447 RepID=A0A3P8WP82_CYNSE